MKMSEYRESWFLLVDTIAMAKGLFDIGGARFYHFVTLVPPISNKTFVKEMSLGSCFYDVL